MRYFGEPSMKINLLYDSNELRSDFVNVDPFAVGDEQRVCASPYDLYFCADNECYELLCNDILCFYSRKDCFKILNHFLQKMHHGGKIVISDTNLYELARLYALGKIDDDGFIGTAFGNTHQKKCGVTLKELTEFFKQNGYYILSKKISDVKFVLEVGRP